MTWRRRQMIIAFLFVLPALINFAIFRYIPIIQAIRTSLYQYSLLGGYGDFVWLKNFIPPPHSAKASSSTRSFSTGSPTTLL